ncbi:MAG: DNA primase [Candidatus Bipolaricaulota bacterium]|nr:DNA primase [Candidatus Bipolaricaulota bacterium]MDW8151580.1 DNA primase [Candidatus Bipolaricaulota bacterium]
MGALEEIKARVNLVDLIGRYVVLKPAGKNYKARCPFHPDDTPSLMVSPEKGLWHCFGCGAGGDAIGFLMRIERLSFAEALAKLAQELGVEVRGGEGRSRLLQVNQEALRYFQRGLLGPEGEKARAYLLSRGLGERLWERWGLGYAPPAWDGLLRALSRFGVQTLLELGLAVAGERGPYDRFRDRVMFAIRDEGGRVVAFAGRAFEGEPKYLNTPNTPLFTKGTVLYGLDLAKEAIRRRGQAVVVEGYTDVISLHAAGIEEAVASMGTSLTPDQARLLSRYAEEVVIAYDRDAAGEASALRGMLILRQAGLRVRVASLPPGEDPDSFVRQAGGEAMRAVLGQAQPFQKFFLAALASRHDLSRTEGKEAALREAQALWPEITSPALRLELLTGLASLLSLPPEEVQEALRGVRRPVPAPEREPAEPLLTPEDLVVRFLLEGKLPDPVVSELLAEEERFCPAYREVVRRWAEARAAGERPAPADLLTGVSPEAAARTARALLTELRVPDEARVLEEALARFLYLPRLTRRMEEVRAALREAEARADGEAVRRLSLEFQHLCRQRLELLRKR